MFDVSAIIVTRNTKDMVLSCLASLGEGCQSRSIEVIVVDNASSDGTAEAISERFPDIRVIISPENLGFGKANNLAASEAAGQYLLLLNSDAVACPSSIDLLAGALDADPGLGMVVPRLVGKDGKPQEAVASLMTPGTVLLRNERRRAKKAVAQALSDGHPLPRCAYLCGAAMMIRRSAFEQIDGFDESFFFYCEDADLSKRIADAGWTLATVPEAEMIHFGGTSADSVSILANIERNRGRCYYIRKHYGRSAAAAVAVFLCLTTGGQALASSLWTVLTLGTSRRHRVRTARNATAFLWFASGMSSRGSRWYRTLFGDWEGKH